MYTPVASTEEAEKLTKLGSCGQFQIPLKVHLSAQGMLIE
jgi:hypothetical protein